MTSPMGGSALREKALRERMSRIRIAVVVALAGLAIYVSVSLFRGLFWLWPSDFAEVMQTDLSLRVIDIEPGGEADRAGIRVGDRVEGPVPARPKLGMALSPQSAAASLMLVGAHANGRLPDRDEVRSIGSLLRALGTVGTETFERVSPMAGVRVVS